jgi:hypothetical protein
VWTPLSPKFHLFQEVSPTQWACSSLSLTGKPLRLWSRRKEGFLPCSNFTFPAVAIAHSRPLGPLQLLWATWAAPAPWKLKTPVSQFPLLFLVLFLLQERLKFCIYAVAINSLINFVFKVPLMLEKTPCIYHRRSSLWLPFLPPWDTPAAQCPRVCHSCLPSHPHWLNQEWLSKWPCPLWGISWAQRMAVAPFSAPLPFLPWLSLRGHLVSSMNTAGAKHEPPG